MAVLGRLLLASGERLDLADVLSIDSYAAGDFKYLLQGLIGATNPLILKGFEVINPGVAIGTQNISIGIADSVVLYPSSLAGPFYVGLPAGNAHSQPLVPELVQNATNYVYVTFTTFETAQDARAFWDPDLNGGDGGEFTQDINTESVLGVQIGVSTASFPDNTIPICQVVMGATVIASIEDCRPMMFRLGTGGLSPNAFNRFNWPNLPFTGPGTYERLETPGLMSSALQPNPFEGGDKNIQNLKQWMDAVMSKLAELGGSTYWYEDVSAYNLVNLFQDALGISVQSKGLFEHSSSTPGQLTWTEDIVVESIPYLTDVIIRSGSKTLNDQMVMYIPIVRDQPINNGSIPVSWFNTFNYVNGPVTSFQNLVQGDWIKAEADNNDNLLRVEQFYAGTNLSGGVTTPALAQSIRLSGTYLGITQSQLGVRTQGVYTSAQVLQAQRGSPTLDALGGNLEWIATRSDTIMNIGSVVTTTVSGNVSGQNGSTATFTAFAPHGLVTGDRITISGSVNYNGTYQVDVSSATVFTFPTTVTTPELTTINAYYAIVTTIARDNGYGLQLENADHGFADDETIIIAGTPAYDGSPLIKVRTATTFEIPVASALASASTGTATKARIFIREEFSGAVLNQGQNVGVGNGDLTNILSYIGMGSLSETHPTYNEPVGYNTLLGQSNYNGTATDNLTNRAAQLTAMMADKAQDKTIKLLVQDVDSVTNTPSAGNQVISFNASPGGTPQLNFVLPGSPFNFGTLGMTGFISLAANQVAYVSVDRNTVFNYATLSSVVVSNIQTVPIDENIFIIAIRLNTTAVWLWDATFVGSGMTVPLPGYLDTIVDEDRNLKLVRGGDWSWTGGTSPVTLIDKSSLASFQGGGLIGAAGGFASPFIVGASGISVTSSTFRFRNFHTGAGTVTVKIYSQIGAATYTNNGQTFTVFNSIVGGTTLVTFGTGAPLASGTLTKTSGSGDPTITFSSVSASGSQYTFTITPANASSGLPNAVLGTSDVRNVSSLQNEPAPYIQEPFTFSSPLALGQGIYFAYLDLTSTTGNLQAETYDEGVISYHPTWSSSPPNSYPYQVFGSVAAANTLSWSADANIQIPGLAESVNLIPAGSVPLSLDDDVAYVEINRAAPGGTLPISVANISAVTLDSNIVIIARRIGSDVVVGNNSMRLILGESKPLYAGISDQNLSLIGSGVTEATALANYSTRGAVNRTVADNMGALDAIANIDAEFDKYLGQFRLIAKTAGTKTRVRITGSDRVVFTGETLGQEISSLRVSFTGAEIDFATGNIFGGDATLPLSTDFSTPLGVNFTPQVIAANHYLWYSIAAIPSGTNADNTLNVQFNTIAGTTDATTPTLAQKPPFGGTKKIGHVVVKDNGSAGVGTILNFDAYSLPAASAQSKIMQLGVGSGTGSGTGLQKVRLHDPVSTTLPTGNPVTLDGQVVNASDLVLFSNLSSNPNKIYKAIGTGTNITSWQAQFAFDGSTSPGSGDTVVITAGTGFADTIGVFTGTAWSFNNKVRYFNGADYWEESSLLASTLLNNSSGTVFSVTAVGSENMVVDFSITRGTIKETGSVYITTEGVNVAVTTGGATLNGDSGVTFSGSIVGPNLVLSYATTNTGANAVMKFSVKRWSDSPGGPGGLPSYSGGGGGSVTGSGVTQQLAIWSGTSSLTGSANLTYDSTNNALQLGQGLDVLQYSVLQDVAIPSGPQTDAALFTYSTSYTFAVIEYSVLIGSNYRIGTLMIVQDGVSTVNVIDTYSEVGSTGLTFASPTVNHSISAGLVHIKFNATGVGAGTFKYSMRRWA